MTSRIAIPFHDCRTHDPILAAPELSLTAVNPFYSKSRKLVLCLLRRRSCRHQSEVGGNCFVLQARIRRKKCGSERIFHLAVLANWKPMNSSTCDCFQSALV